MTLHTSDSWRFDVNEVLTSELHTMISFGDRLAAAGWSIIASSNGSAVSAATRNDATRWNNADAWEHWRDPLGNRDLTLQRGTTNRNWRAYLGQYGDPFSGGTALVAPIGALIMVQLLGSGGSYASNWIPSTFASYKYHMGARSIATGAFGDVFEFYIVINLNGSGASYALMNCFAVSSPAITG